MLRSPRSGLQALRPLAPWAVTGLLALAGACGETASGPDAAGVGYVALQPTLPTDIRNGEFSLGIDAVGLRLQRHGIGDLVVDTVLEFHPDSAALHAAIRVGMLRRVEEFAAELSLLGGDLVLFSGSKVIVLQQGPPGTNPLDSIAVAYRGPGSDIASIEIQPRDTVLAFGERLPLRVLALDSGGSVVARFFASWSASDSAPGRVNAYGLVRAPDQRGGVTVFARTPNGASASARVSFVPGPPYHLLVPGGDAVSAPVGSAARLVVRVMAQDGLGVQGIPVRFRATTPGGAVTDSLMISDPDGVAGTQVLLGETLGDYVYHAWIEAVPPTRFTASATAGPPAALGIEGGDGQAARAGQELAQPVAVRVRDAHGNPVRGQRVAFVVTSGGGAVWAGSNNTNDSGVAMERWTLGTSTAEAQWLEARAVDNTSGAALLFAAFNATALPGPAVSTQQVRGGGQVGTVGTALAESLVVRVVDQYGNPVPGVSVTWAAEQGSVFPATVMSDGAGEVRAVWVLGTGPGTQRATAAVEGLEPLAFAATAAVGPAASLAALAGTGQTAAAGAPLAESLAVRLADAFGNAVPGVAVSWTAEDGGTLSPGGPTGADGIARARWLLGPLAGSQRARATAGDRSADFDALAVAGPPVAVTVSGSATLLNAIGDVLDLDVAVRDQLGNPVAGVGVTWSSSDPSVAEVDADGRVIARGNGSARITAGVGGGVTGYLDVTVAQAVARIGLTPDGESLTALGETLQLAALAHDANGNLVAGAVVAWSSSDPNVAMVDAGGKVTARANGPVTISARAGEVVASVHLTVAQTITAAQVTPDQATLAAVGASVQLEVTALDRNGNAVEDASVTWMSSADEVATVSPSGLVTAVGPGEVTISATVSGGVVQTVTLSVGVSVSVAPSAVGVLVAPEATTLTALGQSAELTGTPVDLNGTPVAGIEVVWESSNPMVATVSATGLVTAVGNGSAVITATAGGVSGVGTVTVAQVPAAVAMSPASLSFAALGASTQLSAAVLDANGYPVSAELTWSTSADAVATVSETGLVTAVGNGETQVSAAIGGVSGIARVTVSQMVVSVTVEPSTVGLAALGGTVPLSASVVDAGGHPVSAFVSWVSSDDGVAAVNGSGLVTAMGNGTATITASSGGVSGTATVTVGQSVATVLVTPASAALGALGATVQLSAGLADADGHPIIADITWTSSSEGVAAVSEAGLVTAVGNGSAVIRASAGGVSGAGTVTVAQRPATVTVSPASLSFVALGAGAQLSVTVRDANGHDIPDAEITWLSSNPDVVMVNANGGATAVGNGTATITGTSGEVSAAASVTVAQAVASVTVSPATLTLAGPGVTGELRATARDANGYEMATSVTWSSSNEEVAVVDAAGVVNARATGSATVAATMEGVTGSASVTVGIPNPPGTLEVTVVVKPGVTGEAKPINLRSPGVTPVAVLTTMSFDASDIALASVTCAGAPALRSTLEDVDRDGDLDMLFHFDTQHLNLSAGSTSVTLQGFTVGGQAFQGTALVRIAK